MNDTNGGTSLPNESLVGRLADEFLAAHERGELDDFADRCPKYAAVIRRSTSLEPSSEVEYHGHSKAQQHPRGRTGFDRAG